MQSFYQRFAIPVVLVALGVVPLLLFGVRGALQESNNDVRQWLPEGFKETRQYDRFLEQFGSEEMIVASWPGATLDDPRLNRFAAALAPYVEDETAVGETGDAAAAVAPGYFRRITTGPAAIGELTRDPVNLSPTEAARRLQGTLIGPDGRTSGAVITVSGLGAADRHAALDVVYRAAEQSAGIPPDQLHLGGPTVDSVALDSESQRLRYLLAAVSVVVSLVLASCCLRQRRLVTAVFATALLCAGMSVSLVHFTGGTMSLLMVMMPTLVYVLAISAAIHLVGYYREALHQVGPREAPARAVADAWKPCVLTALTTSLGLGSLGVSEVIPVKMFGIYAALGVMASLPIVLLLLPSLLQLWPAASAVRRREEKEVATDQPQGLLGRASGLVVRYHGWIAVSGASLMLLCAVGLARLETSVKLLNLFSPQSRIIADYRWLEEHLGPLVPVELVVEFNGASQHSLLERVQLVSQVQKQIAQVDKVGGTTSAATFVPQVPDGGGLRQTVKRSMIERNLRAGAEQGTQYLQTAREGQLWRISTRVEALNSIDYGRFIQRLREQVEPVFQMAGGAGVEVIYTGVVPLVYKAQRALLDDLTASFFTAFLLIGIVMIVMLRSPRAGLVAMFPNLFPAVLIFGGMGWMGRLCDIGSMMTASVALGIAVDDTIHYLTWFRRGIAQGLSRRDAILLAYRRCAGAMLQTTIICGLGLLVFAFSSFVPTARFAYLMFMLLMAALVGDLIFLPALLAGPLGKLFEKSRRAEPVPQPEHEPLPALNLAPAGH